MTIHQFLADLQTAVEPREIASQAASWDAEMNATPETQAQFAAAESRLQECYSDRSRYDLLKSIDTSPGTVEARQRDILLLKFAATAIAPAAIDEITRRESELGGIFGAFRAEYKGRLASDNELRTVLLESPDVDERREAWQATKSIGGMVAPKLLELVALRNREARQAGFANYYAMSLSLQEFDEAELFGLLDTLSEQIGPAFRACKSEIDAALCQRFHIGATDLRPWHYADPFFQEAPTRAGESLDRYFATLDMEKVAAEFFDAIGLPIDDLLPLADLYERPGKSQYAFCCPVGRGPSDVRVCCNLQPDAKWMSVMLHEFGHAVYHKNIDEELPFFVRSVAHIASNEAIAQFMGRFATNADWLVRWAGVEPADAARVAVAAHRQHVDQMLILARWVLVMTHFERELYSGDPDQDFDELWWRLVSRYQEVNPPDDPPRNAWASKIHLSLSPVYYHSYLMGETICSQILHALRKALGADAADLVDSPLVGKWLTERYFRLGALYPWNEHLRRATDETLNTRYFVDELTVARRAGAASRHEQRGLVGKASQSLQPASGFPQI